MSDEFIRGLEHDLVEAMDRYERRSPRRRLATALNPGLRRLGALGSAAAVVAILLAGLVTWRDLLPEPPPARPHVVAVLSIGGVAIDVTAADGSLWVTDYTGRVVQIDPSRRRVLARIEVTGSPSPIVSSAGAVWVQTQGTECKGNLLRIDAGSRRIVTRVPLPYPTSELGALAGAGEDAVWVKPDAGCSRRQAIERIDAAGSVTARAALGKVDGLASAAGSLWALDHDGTLTQTDITTGRIRHRWPQLAPLTLSDSTSWNTKALVADSTGAWVLDTRNEAVLHVSGGDVVRRIRVGSSVRPLLAKAPDGLWIATADRLGSDHRLIRIDAVTGRVTATLALGIQQPVALISTGDQLCVLTGNGTVLVIQS
jgi:hypothetical protein